MDFLISNLEIRFWIRTATSEPIQNPKSQIQNRYEVSKKSRLSSIKGFGGNLTGAFRFELKTPVLETGILPIETTRLKNFRFLIEIKIANQKSKIKF